MSLNSLSWARTVVCDRSDLSAGARLTLLSLADRSTTHGQSPLAPATSWGATAAEAEAGLVELVKSDLVWFDSATESLWLTFIPGWFRDWQDRLWLAFPPTRPHIPAKTREAVLLRDGSRCAECGSGTDLCIDHVWPVLYGGLTELWNLATLCRSCNSKKGTSIPKAARQSGWVLL